MLVLLSSHFLCAQKIVKKSVVNTTITSIQIDANNCFEVVMTTSGNDELIAEAVIDGEYQKDLELNVKQEGSTMIVSAGFRPNFINPNDKLSAHKVISIALKLTIPEFSRVHLFGTSSNVDVQGWYENLEIALNDGKCVLNKVKENVKITTQSGAIIVRSPAAKINAVSKYGNVLKENIPENDHHFLLRSTTGDITVKKTE